MKILKQLILAVVMVTGLSIAASAQKDDQKKPRVPKDPPPVVTPGDKRPPRDNPPRDGNKPKKPGYAMEIAEKAWIIPSA